MNLTPEHDDDDAAFAADEAARIAALHKSAPDVIWLQVDPEAEQFDGWEAQTWCSDRINESDVEYAKVDEIDRLRAEVAKMQAEHEDIEKLRTIATLIKELAKGSDWNNGAHAKFYRHQLLAALAKDSSHE